MGHPLPRRNFGIAGGLLQSSQTFETAHIFCKYSKGFFRRVGFCPASTLPKNDIVIVHWFFLHPSMVIQEFGRMQKPGVKSQFLPDPGEQIGEFLQWFKLWKLLLD